ncbi:MAG: phosphate signaling complex protein PhoU [Candidatus Methanosuratincola sp.]|jgi:phosphate transport system protein
MIKLELEINALKKKLYEMAALAEDMVNKCIRALREKNMVLAEEVIKGDKKVNDMEIEIDKHCTKILALYQPEAEHLRTVLMTMKINNELERIGDHAVNIAERAIYLADKPSVKPLIDIPRMAEQATLMLKESLDSFVNKDPDLAIEVCKKDDLVDRLYNQVIRELMTYMAEDPTTIDRCLALIMIGKDIERIADLATNIAEAAVYVVQGKIIKHHLMDAV